MRKPPTKISDHELAIINNLNDYLAMIQAKYPRIAEMPNCFEFNGDAYFYPERFQSAFPKINGFPILNEMVRTSTGSIPPVDCKLVNIINYDPNLDEPDIFIYGMKGRAHKSNKATFLTAIKMAKGYKGIMVDSEILECRHLCMYGVFTEKGDFTPFTLNIWVPDTLDLERVFEHSQTFEWQKIERNNVHYLQYSSIHDVLPHMKPYTMNVFWDGCYELSDRVKLFCDINHMVSYELTNKKSPIVFPCHELGRYIPSHPGKGEEYRLVTKYSSEYVDARKNNVCNIFCAQLRSDSFWKVGHKYTYELIAAPYKAKDNSDAEEASLYLGDGYYVITSGGWYLVNYMSCFPELIDQYRLTWLEKIHYPPHEKESDTTKAYTKRDVTILLAHEAEPDKSQDKIASEFKVAQNFVSRLYSKYYDGEK